MNSPFMIFNLIKWVFFQYSLTAIIWIPHILKYTMIEGGLNDGF